MLGKSLLLAALAAISAVNAQNEYLGFNYGAAKANGQVKVYDDFLEEFELAQKLAGTSGKFSSARLYTMIQGPSKDDPIEAIEAAIKTKTTLLLGIWCSVPTEHVTNEINALLKAINKYGKDFTDLVVGLSVGSEDLYRNSIMGIENKSGIGAEPDQLLTYINMVKKAIANTPLKSTPIGHVDTWTVWVNGSNNAVTEALDWVGFDAYPYFQSTMDNSIEVAPQLFWDAFENTQKATGKEVWITETGWPVAGKDMNLAKANTKDAQTYWNTIGCALFGNHKTWWYMLRDADPTPPETEFGVVGADLKPYYDLSCKNAKPVPSPVASTSAAPSSTSAPSRTNAPSTRAPGTTFEVESSTRGSSGSSPTGTAESAAKTTDGAPSSGFAVKATMGFVAAQVIAAAFFLL